MRITPLALLTLALLAAAGCKNAKSDGLDGCAVSVGTCNPRSEHCGVEFACDDQQLALKCTPPAEGAQKMECQCVENNVLGNKVEVVFPMQGDARAVASTACGWKR